MPGYFDKYTRSIQNAVTLRQQGKVTQVIGLVITSIGPAASVGELCRIHPREGGKPVLAEVVGFRDNLALLMPLGDMSGINPGSIVESTGESFKIDTGSALLGRIVNGLGQPIDGKGPLECDDRSNVYAASPPPLKRIRITEPMITGIRSLDTFTTCGKGQRLGIFAGSGVGKSVMMGMIAKHSRADVNVIGLIGERGREVRDFIERDLGEEGLKRSVVVTVTSDEPALIKVKGALVATTIAEYFRNNGKDVILMVDSVTRIAMALREIGLAVGEPPATKGYTPSVFAFLPKFLERPGLTATGSVTGIYTVLVEGDDFNEPVSDAVRSILDGHVTLSRRLANRNHYPAVDVLDSVSRVMPEVISNEHRIAAGRVRELLAAYRESEDLITIGAYVKGADRVTDEAISKLDDVNDFLRQDMEECAEFESDVQRLKEIVEREEIQIPSGQNQEAQRRQKEAVSARTGESPEARE
jgi:flagellum-specific ATP synthase